MNPTLDIDVEHAQALARELADTPAPQVAPFSPPPIPGAGDFLAALAAAHQATTRSVAELVHYVRWCGEESAQAVSLIDATSDHTAATLDGHGELL